MSIDVYVFLKKSNLPSATAWQAAILAAGLPVALHGVFDPSKDNGFVPCRFENADTGFEYSMSSANEICAAYPGLNDLIQSYDTAITFSWGGDIKEFAVAIVAAGVLAHLCSGVMYDPQESTRFSDLESLAYARNTLASIGAMVGKGLII
jgi:hypothetical protein